MRKHIIMLSALLAVASALFAEHQPDFSLKIHPIRGAFGTRDTITLEVTTTNLTDRKLDFKECGQPYAYDVRRDGVPVSKIEHPELILVDPKGLPPHRSVTGDVYVNAYMDMTQPGTYTIQLQKGNVRSNVVTLTVEP